MGVRYDEFWDLSPRTLQPFIKAFELKTELEDRARWEQGLYIRLAIQSSLSDKVKYPDKNLYNKDMTNPQNKMEQIKEKFLRNMEIINMKMKE